MTVDKRTNKTRQTWPWWRWLITGLSTLAAVLSISLSWHYLSGGSMIGCGGGSPCDVVLNSKWSMIAGLLPVSSLAVGVYFALLVASLSIGSATETPIRQLAWKAMVVLVGAIAGSAAWFLIVQKWIIGDFCPYCTTTHLIGLFLAVLVVYRAIKEPYNPSKSRPMTKPLQVNQPSSAIRQRLLRQPLQDYQPSAIRQRLLRPAQTVGLFLIGLVLAGMLVAFQVGTAPSTVYKDGNSQNNLPAMDYTKVPLVGSAEASYKVTLLFDYNCTHCQKIHFMLPEAVSHYNGKLAFVLCPTPLNTKCNAYVPRDVAAFKNSCELTKIGLAVWAANREAFPEFENWMFSYESGDKWQPRKTDAAKAKAIELVGLAAFEAANSNPWIEQYLQTSVRIFGQTLQGEKGGIPKLVYGSRWVIPEPTSADDLITILQKSLALPRP